MYANLHGIKYFKLPKVSLNLSYGSCPMTIFIVFTLMSSFTCFLSILKIYFAAEEWSPTLTIVVITSAVSAFSTAIIAILAAITNNKIKAAQELSKLQRIEDSQERKDVAQSVKAEVTKAAEIVTQDTKEIKESLAQNTEINVKAIEAANNHNEKIATLTEKLEETSRIIHKAPTGPVDVNVVNTKKHPVPITTDK